MGRWHSSGGRGRHETVHRDARQAVAWLDQSAEVEKVVIGPYKPGSGRGGRSAGAIMFQREYPAGLRVHVATGDGLLQLTLLVAPANRTRFLKKLSERFPQYADRTRDPRRRDEKGADAVLL
jgi:hypothetical protein